MPKLKKSIEFSCKIMSLPEKDVVEGAQKAVVENPANAPMTQCPLPNNGKLLTRQNLAVITGSYWGAKGVDLGVSFIETVPQDLRDKILKYANYWNTVAGANVRFRWVQNDGDVRVTLRGDGYWSYLGTDILTVPRNQPTLCLQGFSISTPDSEYERVVVHEFGHTLGFPHEHLRQELVARIDRAKAIRYFLMTQGWSQEVTVSNVLTPLDQRSIMGTPTADEDSIMCYPLPGSITKDGRPIRGGARLAPQDITQVKALYPPSVPPIEPPAKSDRAHIRIAFAEGVKLPDFNVYVYDPDKKGDIKLV